MLYIRLRNYVNQEMQPRMFWDKKIITKSLKIYFLLLFKEKIQYKSLRI